MIFTVLDIFAGFFMGLLYCLAIQYSLKLTIPASLRILIPSLFACLLILINFIDMNASMPLILSLCLSLVIAAVRLKRNIIRMLFTSVLFLILIVILDLATGLFLVEILGITNNVLKQSPGTEVIINYVNLALIYVILSFLKYKGLVFEFLSKLSLRHAVFLIATCIVAIVLVVLQAHYLHEFASDESYLLLSLLFFITIIFIIYITTQINNQYVRYRIKLEHTEKEYRQLQTYTEAVENLIHQTRRYKHDMGNVLNTIYGYIQLGKIEMLKSFFVENINPNFMQLDNQKWLSELYALENPAIKGLLATKLLQADSQGISIEILIYHDIPCCIDIMELTRILGILLDNAIEAASISENKKIRIVTQKNENDVSFVIANSCTGNINTTKIYQAGYSTKGKDRGYGLFYVNKTVSQYNQQIKLISDSQENWFSQTLFFLK